MNYSFPSPTTLSFKVLQKSSSLFLPAHQQIPKCSSFGGFVGVWGLVFVGFFGKMLQILLIFPNQVTLSLSFPQKGSNSGT